MATLLFSLMMLISSIPANYKIGMANIAAVSEMRISETQVLEAPLLTTNAWTGEKTGDLAPVIETLQAKEESIVAPNDGILNALTAPSSIEDRISIPSLDVNAPMVQPALGRDALDEEDWNLLEDQIRESLLDGVVHYPGTANPGKKGNFFVTGHSSNVFWEQSAYNSVFALLPKIEVGAEIIVTKNQREYVYVVTEKKEVSPKDVSVLSQGDDFKMTLMTCTPVGTTLNRLVVTAELKD
jgi:LPXTG-site transpeptidase (sortase) family protein